MAWPGGKAGAGVYQAIINQIPPHAIYIEPFVGGGAILRAKRPAPRSIAIDLSDDAAALWRGNKGVEFHQGCGIAFLASYRFTGREFVYLDPPYLISSRRSQRPIYEHELGDLDHALLLATIRDIPAPVAISGYRSELYDRELADWRHISFPAATRGGGATEHLWMNYPAPPLLHDWRYVGSDYRDRENIRRLIKRWRAKFAGRSAHERQAILSALCDELPSLDLPLPESGTAEFAGEIAPAVPPVGSRNAVPDEGAAA